MRRLKAEWEEQSVVLMAFPHEETDWAREGDLRKSLAPFVRIAQAIAYSQTVYILCKDRQAVDDLFCSTNNMVFIEAEYNDTWIRDYGPLSAEDDEGNPLLLDFVFDGWGGKFEATLDNRVNRFLHEKGYFGTTPMESRYNPVPMMTDFCRKATLPLTSGRQRSPKETSLSFRSRTFELKVMPSVPQSNGIR